MSKILISIQIDYLNLSLELKTLVQKIMTYLASIPKQEK